MVTKGPLSLEHRAKIAEALKRHYDVPGNLEQHRVRMNGRPRSGGRFARGDGSYVRRDAAGKFTMGEFRDGLIYRGMLDASVDHLPLAPKVGDTYRVKGAGYFVGTDHREIIVAVGDFINFQQDGNWHVLEKKTADKMRERPQPTKEEPPAPPEPPRPTTDAPEAPIEIFDDVAALKKQVAEMQKALADMQAAFVGLRASLRKKALKRQRGV